MTMAIDYDALDVKFNHHAPDEDAITCHEAVRAAMRAASVRVLEVTEPGREQSLALTKLEEAMFWANAAVAREGR
jgi:hypothetical protein